MRTLLASVIVLAAALMCALALAMPNTNDTQPDITVAPCTMHTLPAYTDTTHCIDADGTIVTR